MRKIKTLVKRYPRHELAIHRLHLRDVAFRTICIDYDDAQRWLEYWRSRATPSARKIRLFRQILMELEADLLGMIENSLSFAPVSAVPAPFHPGEPFSHQAANPG
jgi:hypothetical protein